MFGVFFWFLFGFVWYCLGTVQLLFCLRGLWYAFVPLLVWIGGDRGRFRVPFVVEGFDRVPMCDPPMFFPCGGWFWVGMWGLMCFWGVGGCMVVGAQLSCGQGWRALDPPTGVRISPGLPIV